MDTFIMLKRSEETLALIQNPMAFTLLTIIAVRARRTNSFNVNNLKVGEALIGDYKNYGMTERSYRTAKKNLVKWSFATFRGTNKGTIATLCDKRVYDINRITSDEQKDGIKTDERRTVDERPTTNNNVNNENNDNNDNIYTLQQCQDEFFKQGLTDDNAEKFYNHYSSQGWLKGNSLPITDLSAQVTNWRLNPKQYEVKEDKDDFMRKVMKHAKDRDRREGKGIMASVNTSGDRTADENLF